MKALPRSLSFLLVCIAASIVSFCQQWAIVTHRSVAVDPPPFHLSFQKPKDGRRRIIGFLPQNNNGTSTTNNSSRWAYAYLMAGVDKGHPSYLGIFYNILVSAKVLRDSNSTADIIAMVQMSTNATTNSHRLTPKEEDILTRANVRIYYLEVPTSEQSFYTMQLDKFRILEFIEYDRVMYLDGDVLPFCSMDYLFELSMHTPPTAVQSKLDNISARSAAALPTTVSPPFSLKENIILAWRIEPAHGGAFVLTPREGDYEQLQQIVRRLEQSLLAGHEFSKSEGWGHIIAPPDAWHSTSGREGPNAVEWAWHGDFADQGLLYFWTKYFKRDVSIVIGADVENWSGSRSELLHRPLIPYGCVPKEFTRPFKYANSGFSKMVPYRDFKHFTGRAKPWLAAGGVNMTNTYRFDDVQTAHEYWFYLFRQVQHRFQLTVDIQDMHRTIPMTHFGGYPTIRMARANARAKFSIYS